MSKSFRLVDTGVREGRSNIAMDMALIEECKSGRSPDTVRFMQFPPTALIGRHQDLSGELQLDLCRREGIGTVRRITGGGAIYLDPGQLGWELIFHRATLGIAALPELTEKICLAVASGLRELGVDARFRPRNDIEVDGRKISGTGGFFDGDILIYQGTVLVDMDGQQMARVLKVPEDKLAKRELDSAAQRVVTLRELLGDATPDMAAIKAALLKGFGDVLGCCFEHGETSAREEALAQRFFDEEIGTEEYVAEIDDPGAQDGVQSGSHCGAGGTVTSFVKLEGPTRRILQRVLISGDFFVTPPRVIFDLEARLQGISIDELGGRIDDFFAGTDIGMLSVTADDFRQSIVNALDSHPVGTAGEAHG